MLPTSVYASFGGNPVATFQLYSSVQSLQGASLFPAGIQTVNCDAVLMIPRSVGTPNIWTMAFAISSGSTTTFQLGDGALTATIPSGGKIAFITAEARADPALVDQTLSVIELDLLVGADNVYSVGSTVVSGFVRTGVPNMTSWDIVTRIQQDTASKKDVDAKQAYYNVLMTLTPDQACSQNVRVFSATVSPVIGADVIVVVNDDSPLSISGTLAFGSIPHYIRLSTPNRVPLTEIPTIICPEGYAAVAITLSYSAQTGVILNLVENPPPSMQGAKLPYEQYGGQVWLGTVMRKTSNTAASSQFVSVMVSNTFGVRVAVFQNLNQNVIFCQSQQASAVVSDGEIATAYSIPKIAMAMDPTAWWKIAQKYNDPQNHEYKRIKFVDSKVTTMKRVRED